MLNLAFTAHARARMIERNITAAQVYATVQTGRVTQRRFNDDHHTECFTVEQFFAGERVRAVVDTTGKVVTLTH
jgi:hypothetical protein